MFCPGATGKRTKGDPSPPGMEGCGAKEVCRPCEAGEALPKTAIRTASTLPCALRAPSPPNVASTAASGRAALPA